jgi:hypothetical protein
MDFLPMKEIKPLVPGAVLESQVDTGAIRLVAALIMYPLIKYSTREEVVHEACQYRCGTSRKFLAGEEKEVALLFADMELATLSTSFGPFIMQGPRCVFDITASN